MPSRPLGSEGFECENEEWGTECDYPDCSCEEIETFGKFDWEFDDILETEEEEDEWEDE